MKIDRNSYGSLALVYILSAILCVSLFIFVGNLWISLPVAVLLLWFCIWQTFFFVVPVRECVGTGQLVSSVADGKVVILDKVYEPEFLKRDAVQISVYMNFFDTHANFWPVDGEVTYYRYYPGAHVMAFKPKASEENEHTCVGIRTDDGEEIFFKQIAGGFARRIVCYAKEGLEVKAGEQCGIIKFGSRIDMFLPLDSRIKVQLNDIIRACETIVAQI